MDDADTMMHIRERAYYLWESEGRPHGRALDHWLEAERHDRAVGLPEPLTSEGIHDREERTFLRSTLVEQKAREISKGKTPKKAARGRSRGRGEPPAALQ